MRSKWLWVALALVAVLGLTATASGTVQNMISGKQIAPHSITSLHMVNGTLQAHDMSPAFLRSRKARSVRPGRRDRRGRGVTTAPRATRARRATRVTRATGGRRGLRESAACWLMGRILARRSSATFLAVVPTRPWSGSGIAVLRSSSRG